jgi:hypothetical protein
MLEACHLRGLFSYTQYTTERIGVSSRGSARPEGKSVDLKKLRIVALAALSLAAWSCASDRKLPDGVPPEKRDWYGEFYNLDEYAKCRAQVLPQNLACEYLRLTREDEPEYWPYPNVPRPKLPEAPNPPVYREGMTSKQYFDALCKAEAGEFIYKVVENVEGVYQIRPRKRASSNALRDRYVMEDPYGYTEREALQPAFVFLQNYQYFETKVTRRPEPWEKRYLHPSWFEEPRNRDMYERFQIFDKTDPKRTQKEFVTSLQARFGYSWRGIKRDKDRELGIAGGELIVIDLKTGEILGVRRGFARSGFVRNNRSGFNWEIAEVCPRLRERSDGFDKGSDFSFWFLKKVIKPVAVKQ